MQLYAAIDFETATSERTSACAIGYVIFNKIKILKKNSYLIKPPKPEVHFTDIHGLTWEMLKNAKPFNKVWREIEDELSRVDYFFAHNGGLVLESKARMCWRQQTYRSRIGGRAAIDLML